MSARQQLCQSTAEKMTIYRYVYDTNRVTELRNKLSHFPVSLYACTIRLCEKTFRGSLNE